MDASPINPDSSLWAHRKTTFDVWPQTSSRICRLCFFCFGVEMGVSFLKGPPKIVVFLLPFNTNEKVVPSKTIHPDSPLAIILPHKMPLWLVILGLPPLGSLNHHKQEAGRCCFPQAHRKSGWLKVTSNDHYCGWLRNPFRTTI